MGEHDAGGPPDSHPPDGRHVAAPLRDLEREYVKMSDSDNTMTQMGKGKAAYITEPMSF